MTRDGIFRFYKKGQNSNSRVDKAGNPTVPAEDIGTINLLTVDPSRQGLDSSGKVASVFKIQPLPNNYDLGDGFNLGGYRYISTSLTTTTSSSPKSITPSAHEPTPASRWAATGATITVTFCTRAPSTSCTRSRSATS
jgi:hypothetical protein